MVSGANLRVMNGDGIHTWEMARSLAVTGHRVTLVLQGCCQPPGVVPPGIEVTGLPVPGNRLLGKMLWPARVLLFVLARLRRWRYNVFYTREGVFELPVILLLRRLGKRVALEVNTVVAEDLRAKGRSRCLAEFVGRLQKRACVAADVVLPVTESLAGWVMRQGVPAQRVVVVGNGANPDIYRPGMKEESIKKLGLPAGRRYFCFAGNLAPWQGVGVILEALAMLREELPAGRGKGCFIAGRSFWELCGNGGACFGRSEDAVPPDEKKNACCGGSTGMAKSPPGVGLLVVGDGLERKMLEKRVRDLNLADAVIFAGRVAYEDVPVYINACAAGIGGGWHGQKRASAGRLAVTGSSACKVFAYLSCGLPVIVPDLPGVARLVRQERCGLVVKPGDVAGLKEAMAGILCDPSRWAEAGRRGRALIEREASWKHRAGQVVRAVLERYARSIHLAEKQ